MHTGLERSFLINRMLLATHFLIHNRKHIARITPGKCLGTFTFLTYINDAFNITKESKFITYAEEVRIFIIGEDVYKVVNSANTVLELLPEWTRENDKDNSIQNKGSSFLAKKIIL